MVGLTPRPGHRLGHLNLDIFSPITSVVRSQLEQEEWETADTQGSKGECGVKPPISSHLFVKMYIIQISSQQQTPMRLPPLP